MPGGQAVQSDSELMPTGTLLFLDPLEAYKTQLAYTFQAMVALRKLHLFGYSHGDFAPRNVFWATRLPNIANQHTYNLDLGGGHETMTVTLGHFVAKLAREKSRNAPELSSKCPGIYFFGRPRRLDPIGF